MQSNLSQNFRQFLAILAKVTRPSNATCAYAHVLICIRVPGTLVLFHFFITCIHFNYLFIYLFIYKALVHTQPSIILYYQACIQQRFVLASKI